MNSVQSGAVIAHVSRQFEFERVTLAAFHPVDAAGGGRNLSDHSANLGERVVRNREWAAPNGRTRAARIEAEKAREGAEGAALCDLGGKL